MVLVRGEQKKVQWVSKPLYPTYKKVNVSVCRSESSIRVASSWLIAVDSRVYFHFLNPDTLVC
jgi:hypothetical protein